MIRKRNYDRNEVFEVADTMKELMGQDELLDNILKWFSTDDIADCLTDIARNYDITDEVFKD